MTLQIAHLHGLYASLVNPLSTTNKEGLSMICKIRNFADTHSRKVTEFQVSAYRVEMVSYSKNNLIFKMTHKTGRIMSKVAKDSTVKFNNPKWKAWKQITTNQASKSQIIPPPPPPPPSKHFSTIIT